MRLQPVGLSVIVVKAMAYRLLVSVLISHGCSSRQGKGDHEKWYCPCGQHMVVITRTTMVSPGIVRQVRTRLACLPEGWLP
jgi:hypothetical protein